jgi:hypothetical protein
MSEVQRIQEPVRVLASFSERKIRIHFFNWRNRIYKISSANLFHIEKDGSAKRYHFAVSTKENDYQLVYDPFTLEWKLDQVIQP